MRAIVFGGGGTKGSYEIGAWKALRELGVTFDIVTGTSIGALNGAFLATGEFEQAKKLWDHIEIGDIIAIEERDELVRLLLKKGSLVHMMRGYLRYGGLDITPLKELIKKNISPMKIKNSPYKFGVTTVKLPFMTGIEQDLKNTDEEDILYYLLASASCFPVFPACKIHHRYYIDGGYYDNLPIDFALDLGADQVIAIDLNEKGTHPAFMNDERVDYIKPSRSLGPFLFFHQETIKNNQMLGYLDTMKYFHQFEGVLFAFEKEDPIQHQIERDNFIEQVRIFQERYQRVLYMEEEEFSEEFFFRHTLEDVMEYLRESPYRLYRIQDVLRDYKGKDRISCSRQERSVFDKIVTIYDVYELVRQRGKCVLLKFLNFYLFEKEWNIPLITGLFFHFRKEILILLLLKSLTKI